MTKFFIIAIICLNFLVALMFSAIFGHNGGGFEVSLALLASSIWVAGGAAWALKCSKTLWWVGFLIALGTAPTGLALAYIVTIWTPLF